MHFLSEDETNNKCRVLQRSSKNCTSLLQIYLSSTSFLWKSLGSSKCNFKSPEGGVCIFCRACFDLYIFNHDMHCKNGHKINMVGVFITIDRLIVSSVRSRI